ncbi:jg11032 [Pararge aegeria aegeria]|uniref:Jg11032 protein n=773 Tax=Pancrustacea TaxID=197562 RepID=A0A8S4SBZ6_9NEOP|nr:jg11032 [Pararge aegeria aegeria]
MFKNTFQSGFLSILYSIGSKPLQIWDKKVRNGHIKRITDNDIQSLVLEIVGTNVSTTYITCPADPKKTLGIKLPFLVMIIKNLKKYFTFEVQVLDDKNVRRRFRASNYQSTTRVKPFICTMPMRLDEGWNQIQFNLADFTRRAYGTNYVETLRVQIHANCRIRRVYFSDRWKLDPAQTIVQVKEGNTVLPLGSLSVKGYDVSGSENPKFRVEGCKTALLQGVPDSPICYSVTDAAGEFKFGLVPAGEYKLLALSKSPGQATITYNIKPDAVPFTVKHDSLYIKNAFEELPPVPDFELTGLALALSASHRMQVEYKSKAANGVLTVPAGQSRQCVPLADQYTLIPRGCHRVEPSEITVKMDTADVPSISFVATAHAAVLKIFSPEPATDVVLQLNFDGQPEENVPLKPVQDESGYVYEHTVYLAEIIQKSVCVGVLSIRGLIPRCVYTIELKESTDPELAGIELAKSPPPVEVKEKDIKNIRLIIIQLNQLTDVNVLIHTPNIDHYKSLRLTLALESSPHNTLFATKLDPAGYNQYNNPGLMYVMPRLPADNKTYVLQLECSLSKVTHSYSESVFYFNSDGKFRHFDIEFSPKVKSSEQELRQSSLLVLPLLAALGLLYTQRHRLPNLRPDTMKRANRKKAQ